MTQLDHEKLDVYRIGIEFVVLADGIIEALPHGRGNLANQLARASTSIPLNTAEGAGEFSKKEKARFYRMALRSAAECAALLDVFRALNLACEAPLRSGRDLIVRLVSMLTRMVNNIAKEREKERAERRVRRERERERERERGRRRPI
jgi:four helix bundle protein